VAGTILEIPEVRKRVSRLSVAEYHRLGEFNDKGRRTELIRGFVIDLDQVVLIGEGSLRRVIEELMAHYHTDRNHQGLGNTIIEPELPEFPAAGQIRCRERMAGMFRYYYRHQKAD
jgi:hypothetical protein